MQSQDDNRKEPDENDYVNYEVWLESLKSIAGNAEEQRRFVERIARQTGLIPRDVETTIQTLTRYLARKK